MSHSEFKTLVKSLFSEKVSFKERAAGTAFHSEGIMITAKVKVGYDYSLPEETLIFLMEKGIVSGSVNDYITLSCTITND